MPTITVLYFAAMREQRGRDREILETEAGTPESLYEELSARHAFRMPRRSIVVAINDELARWDTPLQDGDVLALLPPISGG